MNETVIAAIIGGIATVIAAAIAVWANSRKRNAGVASRPTLTNLETKSLRFLKERYDEGPDVWVPVDLFIKHAKLDPNTAQDVLNGMITKKLLVTHALPEQKMVLLRLSSTGVEQAQGLK